MSNYRIRLLSNCLKNCFDNSEIFWVYVNINADFGWGNNVFDSLPILIYMAFDDQIITYWFPDVKS